MTFMIPAAIQAVGAIAEGNAQAAQLDAQAGTARDNARSARLQTNAAEETQRRQMAMELGNQRAAAAESGFVSNTGSMLTLQGNSRAEMELDVLTSRYEGMLRSMSFDNEARRLRSSASAVRGSGYLNAASTLTGSAFKTYTRG